MARRALAAFAALILAATFVPRAGAATTSSGRWSLYARSDDTTRVGLRLEYAETSDGGNHSDWSWSSDVPYADAGLSAERLRGPIGPVSFEIVREPGTFACTGSAGNGAGAGLFTYAPAARFDDALAARGLGRPAYRQSLELALAGATLAFIDQLRAGTSNATITDVVRAVQHGVSPRFVSDLASLGYRSLNMDSMLRMRDHGVSVTTVRALQAAGYRNLSPEELVRLADHGIGARYVGELASDGYKNLSPDDLVALRDHGVSAAWIAKLKAHGYVNVSVRDLIRLRDAGI